MEAKKSTRKIIRDHFASLLHEIEKWDELIIATYHYRFKCDTRYSSGSKENLDKHEKYCSYVNDLHKKHNVLIKKLLEMIYPKFLQQYHQTNPKTSLIH
jgi:hypothetical protein